jgi:radical SAM superfamily enzyme YgiQ (UPF0313 family)
VQKHVSRRNKTSDLLSLERRNFQIRFPRAPQAVILFPAPYSSGIANLGFLTIWRRLNALPDFSCDRAFLDPKGETPVRGIETDLPLGAFPLIFISSSFEMDLETVLRALLTAGLEPLREKRKSNDPVIVAGGMSLTLNPEPWGPFVDLALLGEGEEAVTSWMAIYRKWAEADSLRQDLAEASAELPFVWIPDRPERQVIRAKYEGYRDDPAASAAVHPEGHFRDCWLVELSRGCPHNCLFCAVCAAYDPRFAKVEAVLRKMEEDHCLGSGKVGLVGGAVGDHPHLKRLVKHILEDGRQVTVSSLRIERADPELLELLVQGGLGTLTVAPETGDEELRRRLGKKATDDDLITLARLAGQVGLKTLRLYFLIGTPVSEPPEAIINLAKRLRRAASPRLKLDLSVSSFIPKPGTPWQEAPFAPAKQLDAIKAKLKSQLNAIPGISVHFEPTRMEHRAALLSRGSAKLGLSLLRAIQSGRPLEQQLRIEAVDIAGLAQR